MTALDTAARIFVMPILAVMLAGCGRSGTDAATAIETDRLCKAALSTGVAKQCSVNNLDSTVGIVIDTDDEKARTLCAEIAGRIKPASAGLPDNWKLQIFSPYRDDKPLAACFLL
jgi:hypothetical protein